MSRPEWWPVSLYERVATADNLTDAWVFQEGCEAMAKAMIERIEAIASEWGPGKYAAVDSLVEVLKAEVES